MFWQQFGRFYFFFIFDILFLFRYFFSIKYHHHRHRHRRQNLRYAWLTHPFHCCAFKFPQRHDPYRHAQRVKYLAELHKKCMNNELMTDTKVKHEERFNGNFVSSSTQHPHACVQISTFTAPNGNQSISASR